MTHYYHVWVRSDRFRSSEPLTYASSALLQPGQIVVVPLRSEKVLGFVVKKVAKPKFAAKPIEHALQLPPLPAQSLALARWVSEFYAAPIGAVTPLFLPTALSDPADEPLEDLSLAETAHSRFAFTAEQKLALDTIVAPDTYLLHGRTGSGKTEIYIELVRRSLSGGRSAIILSPEIGLTSQLAKAFRECFGERVVTLHSQLTAKQRGKIWRRILRATTPLIVVGPRSALFSPLKDIGLIVIDESHDSAYKQEQAPYYHAVRVAAQMRALHQASLVLGSATPSVTDYYVATERHKLIIRMEQLARADTAAERNVHLIDLKDRTQFTRSPHLSNKLIEAVQTSLEHGEQSLLYLNRRGTARIVLCNVCGWQALCPRCDLPLAYHGDTFRLRCHTCGYNQAPMLACPVCGNPSITLRSFGTKAIVEEVQSLFPSARIMRFDSDNKKVERLEQQYSAIRSGDADILIGTQMLTKGLDLPLLSTLGIILADSSLYLPDYTARERTYQLLTQVMGRIGRGHIASQAFIQTYYPGSSLLQAAINDNWTAFYDDELRERKQYRFPPFCYLLKLSCRRASRESAEKVAKKLSEKLAGLYPGLEIDGPAPAFHEKIENQYQWQLVLRAQQRSTLLAVIQDLPAGWTYDIDPSDLL